MDIERNFGEQPLAQVMRERRLSPAQLVGASKVQLNHKMVSRGMKGRRLTGNVMKKIRDALNACCDGKYEVTDLFTYVPL